RRQVPPTSKSTTQRESVLLTRRSCPSQTTPPLAFRAERIFAMPLPHLRVLHVGGVFDYPLSGLARNESLTALEELLLQPATPGRPQQDLPRRVHRNRAIAAPDRSAAPSPPLPLGRRPRVR